MKKDFLKTVILVSLFGFFISPANLFAGDKKLYLSGSVGALFSEDATAGSQNATLNAIVRAVDTKTTIETGVAITVALGMELMPQVRGEVEYAYRSADVEQLTTNTVNFDLVGGVDIHSFMFNAFYDFDLKSSWTPYIGGGLGVAWIGSDGFGFDTADLNAADLVTEDQTVSGFAYQVMAGVAYEVSDNTDLTAGYRYFGTSDVDFDYHSTSINTHAIEFGLRYSF